MANQRVQVQGNLGPDPFRPMASPVDRFVQPQPGRLAQVAEGLARFAPSLSRFAEVVQTKENEEQMMEGQQRAQQLLDSQVTYKQAVEEGLIRRDQNPWFRLGMKKRFASVASGLYIEHLTRHAKQWAENSTNPEDFRGKEAELRRQWIEENLGADNVDPAFDTIFSEQVNSQVAGIARNYATVAGENAVRQAIDALGAEVSGILWDDSLTEEQRLEKIRTLDREATQEMLLPGDKVTDTIAGAVLDYALMAKDYGALGVRTKPDGSIEFTRDGLLHKLTAGSGPIGDIARVRSAIVQTAQRITQAIEAEWAHEDRSYQNRRNDTIRQVTEAFATAADPLNPTFIEQQAQIYERAGFLDLAQQTRQLAQANQSLSVEGDERYVEELRAGIILGEIGLGKLQQAVRNQEISGTQYQGLLSLYLQEHNLREALQKDPGDPMKHDYWEDGQAFIEKLAQGGAIADISTISVVKARDARVWARRLWLRWWYELGGKDASPEEQRQELDRIFEATRERFFQDQMVSEEQRRALGTDPLSTNWRSDRVLSAVETQELLAVVRRQIDVPSPWLTYKLARMGVDNPAEYGAVAAAQAQLYGIPLPELESQKQPQPQPQGEEPKKRSRRFPWQPETVVMDGVILSGPEIDQYKDLRKRYDKLRKEAERLRKIADRVNTPEAKTRWQTRAETFDQRAEALLADAPESWRSGISSR